MKHIGLFEGIGGFSLAATWMGWETVAWCEIKEFNQRVLKYYWPNATSYTDICKTDFSIHRGTIDILTGGFPCQPYSVAGKRKGKEDERHLWPEMLRAIREIQPTWIVGENVRGLISWNGGLVFDEVQTDLENEGYQVQAYLLPAASVNAPHERYRVWFVAYKNPNGIRCNCEEREEESKDGRQWESCSGSIKRILTEEINANTNNERLERNRDNTSFVRKDQGTIIRPTWDTWPTQSIVCNGNDGLSYQLDSITFSRWRTESIQSGGNAIVPQIAYQIFKAIEGYNRVVNRIK